MIYKIDKHPLILSIESGGEICSVALSRGKELISLRESDTGRNHSKDLALFIEEIFRENNIHGDDLSAVAISKGPGSYTGLRIGMSVAKGLCYGGNIPLISISTLEALAHSAIEDFEAGILGVDSIDGAILSPMIDARRMEVYQQQFDSKGVILSSIAPLVVDETSFKSYTDYTKFYIFGSGAEKCLDVLTIDNVELLDVSQSARSMVSLAYSRYKDQQFEDIAYFEPLYLKEFVAAPAKKLL